MIRTRGLGRRAFPHACVLCIFAVAAQGAFSQSGDFAKVGEWTSYGAGLRSTKYSPLDQIDAGNFSALEIAWRWPSVDGFLCLGEAGGIWYGNSDDVLRAVLERDPQRWSSGSRGNTPRIYNFKATPLMVDGVVYISTPLYQAAAIDAATGKTLWVYDPEIWLAGKVDLSVSTPEGSATRTSVYSYVSD